LTRIPGVGFKKADDVALKLGMKPHAPFRLAAGIEYVMSNMADDGNTLVRPEAVLGKAKEELDCETGPVSLEELTSELEQMEGRGAVVRMHDMISLAAHYTTEKKILEAA